MVIDMKINEIRECNGNKYMCLKGDCTNCAFSEEDDENCGDMADKLGQCSKNLRTDKTEVYFKEVGTIQKSL